MKRLNLSLFLLSALMIGASCSDDNDQDNPENGTASLTVSIKGQPSTRAIGAPADSEKTEKLVSNFTVFVFNYNSGDLEKSQSFTFANDQLTGKISDLSTGTKKHIVTLVNVPSGLDLSGIKAYNDLYNNLITLESQNGTDLATVGLFMNGETEEPITLSAGDNNVIIPVKRKVAKIILKGLTVNANTANLPNFKLNDVSIQKAIVKGSAIGDVILPEDSVVSAYAGGIASPAGATPNFRLTYNFLSEALPVPATYTTGSNIIATTADQRYFYVLPNDNANQNPTMLTLSGTYGTNVSNAYYPFVINGAPDQGTTDGTYIKSNKIYEINVTITHPETPSEDPNTIPSQGVLNVTITPQDWDTSIEQNVEW